MAEPVSQEQAQWLFEEGATVVFLDVPPGTEFGVDYNSWKVGSEFKGVKMIPPGVHFIYYRLFLESDNSKFRFVTLVLCHVFRNQVQVSVL